MAELEQLRRNNKYLLEKLKKQAEKLQKLSLSRSEEEVAFQSSVAFTGSAIQRRASLTERNGEQSTVKINCKQFDEDGEDLISSDQHKHSHSPGPTSYTKQLRETGKSRGHNKTTRLMLPESASVMMDMKQDEFDSATSLSPGQENDNLLETQRIRPLLGYDWIAGLVDAESSLTEYSEQFFRELRSFRQVNRDECIHSSLSGPPLVADLASSTRENEEPQEPADRHQCTFCYRINSRLFATPVDPQTACPVCKMPKSDHPHTDKEPAIIRVSIPRSALLPSYKYKAHRRCSFDPSDSLGLPSHCLSGWSNPTLNSGSQMSSLDLRGYLETPANASQASLFSANNKLDSSLAKQSRHQRSNLNLCISRLPRYHFQHLDPKVPESSSLLKSLQMSNGATPEWSSL